MGVTKERFEQVAYVGVLNEDSTLKMGIPLYVKVFGEISEREQKLINDVAADMVRHYEKPLREYFQKLKREQTAHESIV